MPCWDHGKKPPILVAFFVLPREGALPDLFGSGMWPKGKVLPYLLGSALLRSAAGPNVSTGRCPEPRRSGRLSLRLSLPGLR